MKLLEAYKQILVEEAHIKRLKSYGAKFTKDGNIVLYRGADADVSDIKKLRYNDYLSASKSGQDITGNDAADKYGKNVVRFELHPSKVDVSGAGEYQYKHDDTKSSDKQKYHPKIYKAYKDYYGSNITNKEIDSNEPKDVRSVASQSLSGGGDEFDELTKKHDSENNK